MSAINKSILPLVVIAPAAFAAIDSGGGKSTGGATTNHSSIGEPFATVASTAGAVRNRPGLMEVLYPQATTAGDTDGNGLADAWELAHFGAIGTDPSADPDHDGTTNRMEFLAGTNPNLASSVFRPQGAYQDGVFTLPIPTVSGRSYRIWVTRDLRNWVQDATITGNGTQRIYQFDETTIQSGPLHSPTHPSHYFFRIEPFIP